MFVRSKLHKIKRNLFLSKKVDRGYIKKYIQFSFDYSKIKSFEQYEGAVTRLYHTIEKGLSYENYRAGFGKANIDQLIKTMESYCNDGFDTNAFFYRTALSCLHAYVDKNAEYDYVDEVLNKKIFSLPGDANNKGGSFWYHPQSESEIQKLPFDSFFKSRHSIRHFSGEPVDLEKIKSAIELAQHTPSACNRQGWKTRVLIEKETINAVIDNQKGCAGFGQEFDKIIVVTGDLRYFNRERETYQVFIDGGMYAGNILNALHFNHIGTIPLSASIPLQNERDIRNKLGINDAEVIILIIGVGNYPKEVLTAKSTRHEPRIVIM